MNAFPYASLYRKLANAGKQHHGSHSVEEQTEMITRDNFGEDPTIASTPTRLPSMREPQTNLVAIPPWLFYADWLPRTNRV